MDDRAKTGGEDDIPQHGVCVRTFGSTTERLPVGAILPQSTKYRYTATEARNGGILCVLAPESRREEFHGDLNRVVGNTSGGGYKVTLLMAAQFSVDD